MRANRIGTITGELLFLCETNLDLVRGAIENEKPDVVISFTRRPNYRALVSAIGTHVPVIPAVRQDPKSYYNTWADKLLMPTLYRLCVPDSRTDELFPKIPSEKIQDYFESCQ